MDKHQHIKAQLDRILSEEGDIFVVDEKNIYSALEERQADTPNLIMKLLTIFGALLAMLTFLIFLGISGLYESPTGLLIFGVLFLVSSITLSKFYSKLSIDTFSVSLYITGLSLIAAGLLLLKVDENTTVLLLAFLAFCALFITQDFLLSFISFLVISNSFLFLLLYNSYFEYIHVFISVHLLCMTLIFLKESKIITLSPKLSKLYGPIRIGLVISLLISLIIIGKKDLLPFATNYMWFSFVAIWIVFMYLIYSILKIFKVHNITYQVGIYVISTCVLSSTIFAPSIAGAIVILLLSFLVNYKTGMALGVVFIIYFIGQYYYDLNLTLWTKSIILITSGLLFLLCYLLLTKKTSNYEKIQDN